MNMHNFNEVTQENSDDVSIKYTSIMARWLELDQRLNECSDSTPLATYFNYIGMYLDIDIATAAKIYDAGGHTDFITRECIEYSDKDMKEARAIAAIASALKIRNQNPRSALAIAYWVDHAIKHAASELTPDEIIARFEYTGQSSQLPDMLYTNWYEYIDIWAAGRLTKQQTEIVLNYGTHLIDLDNAWGEFLRTADYSQLQDPYVVRMVKHRAVNKMIAKFKSCNWDPSRL